MDCFHRLAASLVLVLPLMSGLAVSSASAESQSSNSSSNCSGGRCSRVERFRIEDERGARGYMRRDSWSERSHSRRRYERPVSRHWHDRRDRRSRRDRYDDDD